MDILYYVHDPMCSWCWGFRPVWDQVQKALVGKVRVQYVLGGLAADTDQAMPVSMQSSIRDNWQRIQQEIPGIEFNYDFWTQNQPRRSTYPACRAVIASRMQQPQLEQVMLLAIQQAYYLQAKNPSDKAVLIQLAEQTGLSVKTFIRDFESETCADLLKSEISMARRLRANSFPSLVLSQGGRDITLVIDYNSSDKIIEQIF